MNNEPVAFWNKDFDLWEENAIQTYKADGWNIPLYTHPHPDNLGFALSIIGQQKLEIEAMRKDYMVLAGKHPDTLLELKFGKAQEK